MSNSPSTAPDVVHSFARGVGGPIRGGLAGGMTGPVLGVVGGSGGVGASTFAAVLAGATRRAMLVDLDVSGGGIDVLLGIEGVAGARWSALRVGGGRLDPALLADGLPRWGAVPVLAADAAPASVAALTQVLEAAASRGPVVIDLGRGSSTIRDAAVARCALVLVLAAAEVRGLSSARAVAAGLAAAPTGMVVRRGSVPAGEAAELVGVPLIGVVPSRSAARDRAIDARRPPRALTRVTLGVLDAVAS